MKIAKKIGYWLVSLTWGLPITLIGLFAALGLLIAGYKPYTFHYMLCFKVGKSWGGVNFGAVAIVCEQAGVSTLQHEHGHGLQNLWWGPIMLIWGASSAIRYWYREMVVKFGKKNYSDLPPYDAYWLEGQATRLGNKYFKEA